MLMERMFLRQCSFSIRAHLPWWKEGGRHGPLPPRICLAQDEVAGVGIQDRD
jgi:hypothetical protein